MFTCVAFREHAKLVVLTIEVDLEFCFNLVISQLSTDRMFTCVAFREHAKLVVLTIEVDLEFYLNLVV